MGVWSGAPANPAGTWGGLFSGRFCGDTWRGRVGQSSGWGAGRPGSRHSRPLRGCGGDEAVTLQTLGLLAPGPTLPVSSCTLSSAPRLPPSPQPPASLPCRAKGATGWLCVSISAPSASWPRGSPAAEESSGIRKASWSWAGCGSSDFLLPSRSSGLPGAGHWGTGKDCGCRHEWRRRGVNTSRGSPPSSPPGGRQQRPGFSDEKRS